jgi:small subunit ribosomal protein S15
MDFLSNSKENKKKILDSFRLKEGDSGSAQVQIALSTYRLKYLIPHFEKNAKDHHSRRGLIKLVNKRAKLLRYLKSKNLESYKDLIKKLGIRK